MRAATTLALTLCLSSPAAAHAEEVELVDQVVVPASMSEVWGRLARYGLEKRLTLQDELRRLDEQVTLVAHDRDLGLVELQIDRPRVHQTRALIHLAPVSRLERPAKPRLRRRTSVRILVSGQKKFTLQRQVKKLIEVVRTPL